MADEKQCAVPRWDKKNWQDIAARRKELEEEGIQEAAKRAQDIVVLAELALVGNPFRTQVHAHVRGASKKVVDAYKKHIEDANWVVSVVDEGNGDFMIVFDVSKCPEDDRDFESMAAEADQEDAVCEK